MEYLGVAYACDPFALNYCHFALRWSSFDFVARSFETGLDSVPSHRFHSVAIHWAIAVVAVAVVASCPSVRFVDDSNQPSHFCSLCSSPAIVDDAVVRSTTLSWVAMDSPIHCVAAAAAVVAFVVPLDGMMKRNPYLWFA